MVVNTSSPGKIFLMGEHSVVYGKPALISCINKRVNVVVKSSPSFSIESEDNAFIENLIKIVQNHFQIKSMSSLSVIVKSEIKVGFHLGSSAAVSVAVIAALVYFLKKIWNPDIINKLSYKAELLKHGNPSGADNSSVTFGGFIWYRKELEFLKNIWQIPINITDNLDNFYLVDTGKPLESTMEMIEVVKKNYTENKNKMDSYFSKNEEMVKKIAEAIKTGNSSLLIKSLIIGENTLEKIGVVSKKVLPFIRKVEESKGAVKILGGGGIKDGVGYLLCYHPDKQKITNISNSLSYPLEKINLGEVGLRLEKKQ